MTINKVFNCIVCNTEIQEYVLLRNSQTSVAERLHRKEMWNQVPQIFPSSKGIRKRVTLYQYKTWTIRNEEKKTLVLVAVLLQIDVKNFVDR